MEKWVVMAKKADFYGIGETFSIDPVLARIIRNRDVIGEEAIERYLHGDVCSLYSPYEMKDMDRAVAILKEKIQEKKKIRIIGDYDIDGIMSTYILWHGLKSCGGNVDLAIPDRMLDGYGINQRLITEAAAEGVDTVLTCDNGIAAGEVIALGNDLGLTCIVTDHHAIPYEDTEAGRRYQIPPAAAVVNPKQVDCPYPFKELCGGAVAFKLIQALLEALGREKEEYLQYLPYAAFATVGDIMELVGENRILVKEGLKALRETKNPGLLALMQENRIVPSQLSTHHIGFVLGPCLNAGGRLDTARRAVELLQAEESVQAAKLARDLTDLNASRKDLTQKGVEKAEVLAEEAILQGDKVLVLYLADCHESLAGIIAGRIKEKYHRPTFVVTEAEEGLKGSGRSIEAYAMYDELIRVSHLFTRFGGHAMAAGISLKKDNLEELRRCLNENAALTEEDFVPKVAIDLPLPLDYLSPELTRQLSILEPFGKGNEKPLFADRDITVLSAKLLGKNENVCKLQVKSSGGKRFSAVYFGDGKEFFRYVTEKFGPQAREALLKGKGEAAEIALSFTYYPQMDTYAGKKELQLVLHHYR